MTKINGINIKSADFSGLQPKQPDETASTESSIQQEIKAALAEIEQFREENGEFLSEANAAEMDRIETMLKAESAAIDAYGVAGPGTGGASPASATWDLPDKLDPLWNGVNADSIVQIENDASKLSSDPEAYGEYQGTIEIPNSGDPTRPTLFGFQMTDDMNAAFAESRGKDIVFTVEYENGSRKSWVIKDGVTRAEPMCISAVGLSHGVTIDATKLFRQNGSSVIWGTEFNDSIKGSQGADTIVGLAGDDEIYGGAGNDQIWGDEKYQYAGQFDPSYGGKDIISGGAGDDIIYGGAGTDTTFASDSGESVAETEAVENDIASAPPDPSEWCNSDTWQVSDIENDVVTFTNESENGSGGNIDISMAGMPGYTMAFGEATSDGSLLVTFVGDGGSFKAKFEDFFADYMPDSKNAADCIVSLTINGSDANDIMNFDAVETTSQVINLLGGAGDDIVLGAHNKLVKDGLSSDPEKLIQSKKNGNAALNTYLNGGIFTEDAEHQYDDDADLTKWCGFEASVNGDKQIEITGDDSYEGERAEVLTLKAPEGYDHGYITNDEDGNTYVILVKPSASGSAETIVIKIDKELGLGYNEILVQNQGTEKVGDGNADTVTPTAAFILTAISLDAGSYLTSGGDGNDLVFVDEGANVEGSAEEIVWQQVESSYANYAAGNASFDDAESDTKVSDSSDEESDVEQADSEDQQADEADKADEKKADDKESADKADEKKDAEESDKADDSSNDGPSDNGDDPSDEGSDN
jgi:hypothetical protein